MLFGTRHRPAVEDGPLARIRLLLVMLWLIVPVLAPSASGRQTSSPHTVAVGIRPIVAFAVQTSPEPLAIDADRVATFALTSNLDDTRLIASLDSNLPEGMGLELWAETDLAGEAGHAVIHGPARVVVLGGIARGVRSGQVLRMRVTGDRQEWKTIRRELTLGLEDPLTGTVSVQVIPLSMTARVAMPE